MTTQHGRRCGSCGLVEGAQLSWRPQQHFWPGVFWPGSGIAAAWVALPPCPRTWFPMPQEERAETLRTLVVDGADPLWALELVELVLP